MSDFPKNLENMLAIWNSDNPAVQRELAGRALETNVHFVDPNYNILGRDAFLSMVKEVQAKIPGAVYRHTSPADHHNNHYRYYWEIQLGEAIIMSGFDVTEVNDLGKVVKITGFFGKLDPGYA